MDNDVFHSLMYLLFYNRQTVILYRRFPAEKKYLIKKTLRIGLAV